MKFGREPMLGTSQIKATNAFVTVTPSDLSDVFSLFRTELTHGTDNDVDHDGEVVPGKC